MSDLTLIVRPSKAYLSSIFKVVFDKADGIGFYFIIRLLLESSVGILKRRKLVLSEHYIHKLLSSSMEGVFGPDIEVKSNAAYLIAKDIIAYVYPEHFFISVIRPVKLDRYGDVIDSRIKTILKRINSVPNRYSIERVINTFCSSGMYAYLSEDEFLSNRRSLLMELSSLFDSIFKKRGGLFR